MRALAIVALVLAVGASTASAANAPDARLDGVATEIAGRPVTVWCEVDPDAWADLVRNVLKSSIPPEQLRGAIIFGGSWVYLAPAVCLTLRFALEDSLPAELKISVGAALLTLLHESTHQAGVRDENETDCRALGLVRRYAVSLLGVPQRISSTKVDMKRKRIHGRWKRVKVRVRVSIPNPDLDFIYETAQAAHRAMPGAAECSGHVATEGRQWSGKRSLTVKRLRAAEMRSE